MIDKLFTTIGEEGACLVIMFIFFLKSDEQRLAEVKVQSVDFKQV